MYIALVFCLPVYSFVQEVVVFMAGEHVDTASPVRDLMATVHLEAICYVVEVRTQLTTVLRTLPLTFQQAYTYMYLHLGNACMEKSD